MLRSPCGLGLFLVFLFLTGCGGGETDSGETASPSKLTPPDTLALAWAAPAQRADGEALSLSEIASYTIYFGTTSGDYPYSVAIDDPTATDVAIANLPSGIYFVAMTTTDTSGLESGFSEEVAVEVHDSPEEVDTPASGLYAEDGEDLSCKSHNRSKRRQGTQSSVKTFGGGSARSGWAHQDQDTSLASLCNSDGSSTQVEMGSPTGKKTPLGQEKKNKPKKTQKGSPGKAKKDKAKKDKAKKDKAKKDKAKKDKAKKDKAKKDKAKKDKAKKDKAKKDKAKKDKPKKSKKSTSADSKNKSSKQSKKK